MITLGLRANRAQFTLLVLINALVGAMVGLERSVLPLVAGREFGIASATGALAFIATFGLTKALTNLAAGTLADRGYRRAMLVTGWLLALPVPLMVLWAPTWAWIVAANALLGASQGLAWSATVIMKIDLVGPRRRGLAMGLNEFAGYAAVAGAAYVSGIVATNFGLRAGPAYVGIGVALAGLLFSIAFVRDTSAHVKLEESARTPEPGSTDAPTLGTVLRRSLGGDARLFSVSQAGMVNNLNDGLAWGLFPVLFAASGLSLSRVALLAAVYPAVWSVGQLVTGPLSDRWGRRGLVVGGMALQGVALIGVAMSRSFGWWMVELIALGVGTAMVYPSLLAAVGDIARPSWRGTAVGVYRLWRDLGYVVGALLAGALADAFGMTASLTIVGGLTIGSGLLAAMLWREHAPETSAVKVFGARGAA